MYTSEAIGKLIRSEREKRNWTQKKLGEKLSVTGKQVSNYEQGILTPPADMLIKLCEVYNCELGYLLGEDDYSQGTRIQTAICNATGLTTETIDVIQKITGAEEKRISFGYDAEKYRRILNSLLLSKHFVWFIERLGDLDDCVRDMNTIDKQLQEKFEAIDLNEALGIYSNSIDYMHDPEAPAFKPEIIEAYKQIDASIDIQRSLSFSMKIARYELQESISSLISDLYPRHPILD